MRMGQMSLEEAAKVAAGNWREFDCFVWWRQREMDDADEWAIIYTHNRDSGLLDQSNADVIAKALEPFTDNDVVFESHHHWAVGHVDGFSVRVYQGDKITEAFKVYHELAERLANYPILDEADYSNREYEATFENIPLAAWRLKNRYDLPEGWEGDVYSWLSENRSSALDNCDDQCGWPDENDLEAAFTSLGFQRTE